MKFVPCIEPPKKVMTILPVFSTNKFKSDLPDCMVVEIDEDAIQKLGKLLEQARSSDEQVECFALSSEFQLETKCYVHMVKGESQFFDKLRYETRSFCGPDALSTVVIFGGLEERPAEVSDIYIWKDGDVCFLIHEDAESSVVSIKDLRAGLKDVGEPSAEDWQASVNAIADFLKKTRYKDKGG